MLITCWYNLTPGSARHVTSILNLTPEMHLTATVPDKRFLRTTCATTMLSPPPRVSSLPPPHPSEAHGNTHAHSHNVHLIHCISLRTHQEEQLSSKTEIKNHCFDSFANSSGGPSVEDKLSCDDLKCSFFCACAST